MYIINMKKKTMFVSSFDMIKDKNSWLAAGAMSWDDLGHLPVLLSAW